MALRDVYAAVVVATTSAQSALTGTALAGCVFDRT